MYDPRPNSRGGNRGIDEKFSRCAPEGKFRVIGVDTFDGTDWIQGDFNTLAQAMNCADEQTKGEEMLKMHVYDDKGINLYDAGTV